MAEVLDSLGASLGVTRLRRCLVAKTSSRDDTWAYKVNSQTSKIHIRIWEELPDTPYVVQTVIPLLEKAEGAVRQAQRVGKYAKRIDDYAKDIRNRIENITRYTQGLPSRFSPQDTQSASSR